MVKNCRENPLKNALSSIFQVQEISLSVFFLLILIYSLIR